MSRPKQRFGPLLLLVALAVGVGVWLGRAGGFGPNRADGPGVPSTPTTPASAEQPPGPEDAFVVRELVPARPPGEPVLVELVEPPAARYAAPARTEADAVYADVVDSLGRVDLRYDANLGQAARELALQHSLIGGLLPQDIVDFLLRSAGSVDRSVIQGYTRTSGDDMSAVRDRLSKLLGPTPSAARLRRVGIGEAYVPGARQPRYIAIIVSDRAIDVQPAPRAASPGTVWTLTGTLPSAYEAPTGLVLRPSGAMDVIEVASAGRRFTLSLPVGDEPGLIDVSLSADGPFGPKPLLQVPVYVGLEPPDRYEAFMSPDESALTTTAAAEARAFELLNDDRVRFGLEPLTRDPELDEVARAHSLDMRDNGFFGHYSYETGAPGDRLAAAGYRAATHAENVASGPSIYGAETGLMRSLGHRRNILNPAFSHVGIGVYGKREGERVQWFVTQLFSRPVARIDSASAAQRILRRIGAARRRIGIGGLEQHGLLDRIAAGAAPAAAAGGTEGLAADMLDEAKRAGVTRGGAYAWVRVTTDVDALELPAAATDASYTHLGVAVEQLEDHPNGLVGVVLLFTGDLR